MPAYNEGPRIYDNVATTMSVVAGSGRRCEIVVVDDGSPDDTLDEIRRAAADIPGVVAARNPYNMGQGDGAQDWLRALAGRDRRVPRCRPRPASGTDR